MDLNKAEGKQGSKFNEISFHLISSDSLRSEDFHQC